jgi:hypothetical protein
MVVVMGDLLEVAAISQVNVAAQTFWIDGVPLPPTEAMPGMMNSAMFDSPENAETAPETAVGAAHDGWIVTTIAGDVIVMNWIQQSNFLIDHDILSVSVQGDSSWIVTGGNMLINTVDLLELSWTYDLIITDGDMIDVSLIRQTNVLYDEDRVFGGQADTGNNLLWNQAQIRDAGADASQAMATSMAGLASALGEGGLGAGPAILGDAAFNGAGVVRVLHIEGDLISVQAIDQINVVGDADQVVLTAGIAAAQDGAELSLTVGANALVNIAAIDFGGESSVIHVNGEIYSDALLYQASFLSQSDDLPGLPQQGLITEAVAFLADGMIGEVDGPGNAMPDSLVHNGQMDGLNVMLA